MKDCPTCHRPFARSRRMCSSCHKPIKKDHRWHVDGYVNRHDDCANPTRETPKTEELPLGTFPQVSDVWIDHSISLVEEG